MIWLNSYQEIDGCTQQLLTIIKSTQNTKKPFKYSTLKYKHTIRTALKYQINTP
ncbi:hypothetical protein B224_4889 [Aeromonas media WS]|nr:hypothetical protein B224_4889 [Aeromonas media WS]